jgi:hypothetical protein
LDRKTSAVIAANERWAREPNRTAATQQMRDGFLAKLRTQARELLGPGASAAQVEKSVDNLLKAHYARMQAGRRAAADRRRAAMAEEIVTDSIVEA